MANFSVSYDELTAKAEQLRAGRDEINGVLTRLQSQITLLVAQGFTTERASGAFADAFQRFTTGATNTIGGLDDLAAFLRSTATTLREVDSAIAAQIGQ